MPPPPWPPPAGRWWPETMRSLFVTRWEPYRKDGGGALRNAQNIAALAGMGPVDVLSIGGPTQAHEVDGINAWTHFERGQPSRGLPGAWFATPSRHPITDRQAHAGAKAHISSLAPGTYDVAIVEEIALAGYIAPLKAAGLTTVFDAHNVEARLRQDIGQSTGRGSLRKRLGRWAYEHRLAQIEAAAVQGADLVWACSRVDADLLGKIYHPRLPVAVVPNAVDVAAYAEAHSAQSTPNNSTNPLLLYIGVYSYKPNELAALRLIRDILPRLRARGLDLRLALVGRQETPAMRAAAAGDAAVTVTGAVDSILPYLSQPNIVVLPITEGSGTRLKILEAFAAGCPVISSPKGAEGIETRPGENISLAETDDEFTDAITRLAANPRARRELGAGGFETVNRHYSWAAAAAGISASLARLGAGPGG